MHVWEKDVVGDMGARCKLIWDVGIWARRIWTRGIWAARDMGTRIWCVDMASGYGCAGYGRAGYGRAGITPKGTYGRALVKSDVAYMHSPARFVTQLPFVSRPQPVPACPAL